MCVCVPLSQHFNFQNELLVITAFDPTHLNAALCHVQPEVRTGPEPREAGVEAIEGQAVLPSVEQGHRSVVGHLHMAELKLVVRSGKEKIYLV